MFGVQGVIVKTHIHLIARKKENTAAGAQVVFQRLHLISGERRHVGEENSCNIFRIQTAGGKARRRFHRGLGVMIRLTIKKHIEEKGFAIPVGWRAVDQHHFHLVHSAHHEAVFIIRLQPVTGLAK